MEEVFYQSSSELQEVISSYPGPQVELPNAKDVMILGIVSIPVCCCFYGVLSLICAIIALVLANSATKLYIATPEKYLESSYSNLKTGKICAYIGIALSILAVILFISLIVMFGFATLSDPQLLQEHLLELVGQ